MKSLKMSELSSFVKYLNPGLLLSTIFREVLTLIVGSVIVCFYLVIITSSMPIYIYRFLLSKLSKYLDPTLGKMVTARGQFLAIERFTSEGDSPRSNIVASFAIEGDITVDKVVEKLKSNLIDVKDASGNLKYPEATQFVISYKGFKYWKQDVHFDLSNHVKLYESRDQSFLQNDLRDLLELLLNQPFQPEQSPWEILLVNNYTNPDISSGMMTLAIFKFHHCLADGYGAMNTFMSAVAKRPPDVPKAKYMERQNIRLLMFKLTYPIRALREISQFVVMSLKDNPWKIRDKKKAWKLLYQNSPIIPIEKVKEIKNRFGVGFASVIHSCLGSAIEKCLVAKYGLKAAVQYRKMPCIILLPLPGHPLKFRNFCTGGMLQLPTTTLDPLDRLRKCEHELFNVKKSTMPMIGKLLPIIGGSMFEKMSGLLGKNRSFPVSISNFPFSESPFEIDGKNTVNVQAVVGPAAGVCGLAILVHSYVDGIQVSLTGEQGVFSREDLDLMIKAVMDELSQLYSLCLV